MQDRIVDVYAERKRRNDMSKAWAKRDGQPWSKDEDDFLVDEWIHVPPDLRDETTVSQCVERTIEACRVRCEHIRKQRGLTTVTVTVEQKTTVEYRGLLDEPEDQWWSAAYYTEGR